jgi:hypothetical protein
MQIFKTRAFFSEHDADSHLVDTIWHKDAWWLVGSWLESIATKERTPAVLVRLSGLPHHETTDPEYRFFLTIELPKSVLQGKERDGFVVVAPGISDIPGPPSIQ